MRYIASVSFGKDSLAMLLRLIEENMVALAYAIIEPVFDNFLKNYQRENKLKEDK